MVDSEDAAAIVGAGMRTLLVRYDEVEALTEAWLADTDSTDKLDRVLMARDAAAAIARRLVRYFVFDRPREARELDPADLAPGWAPSAGAAKQLRAQMQRIEADFDFFTEEAARGEAADWPFALFLGVLHQVADDFGWRLRAAQPDAARHFDHNLAELRSRLGSV